MVDELDPVLEPRLRAVLRDEADAVPFVLRASELERVAVERRRARRAQRFGRIVAVAAVLAIVATGVAAIASIRPTTPVATGLDGLPSYDTIRRAGGTGAEIARSEGQSTDMGELGLVRSPNI